MKKRVFIDMDGTLYRFHDHILDESGHVQIEKMYELDFFVKLESFENMKEAINLLHSVDKKKLRFLFFLLLTQRKLFIKKIFVLIEIFHLLMKNIGCFQKHGKVKPTKYLKEFM